MKTFVPGLAGWKQVAEADVSALLTEPFWLSSAGYGDTKHPSLTCSHFEHHSLLVLWALAGAEEDGVAKNSLGSSEGE